MKELFSYSSDFDKSSFESEEKKDEFSDIKWKDSEKFKQLLRSSRTFEKKTSSASQQDHISAISKMLGVENSEIFSAKISIWGPPGNSMPSNFAVLSKASPTASSIVVPNLL